MNEIEKAPSIGLSYTVELPGKKALVMQSFVDRDCDPKDLNVVLDKIRKASDRQFAFGAIEQLKLQLEQEEKMAADHAMRIAVVDANVKRNWAQNGRRGDPQLSSAEKKQQQEAYLHARESQKRIQKVKDDIASYKALIG